MDSEQYEDDIDLSVDDDEEIIETEAEEPEAEDDDTDYSKKVQKRIGKVVQQRNVYRDRTEKAESENEQLRAKLAEFDSSSAKAELAVLRQQKIDALEVGDYEAYADIDDKLADIKAKPVYQAPEQQEYQEPIAQQLVDWQQKNKWIFDSDNPRTKKANDIFFSLLDEGYEKDDPELYKIVDRKLRREVPPPAGLPDRGQVSVSSSNFTSQDKTLMAEFGLDPSNKAHRTQWAISKKAANNG
jgi:hypothetical protein